MFDFSHSFLVVTFVIMWGMIAQFAFIKSPSNQQDFCTDPDPGEFNEL